MTFWDLKLNQKWPFYALANKVVTCAYVEERVGKEYDSLLFFDTDILSTQDFNGLFSRAGYQIAAKPDDDLDNIRWLSNEPPDLFWQLICDGCQLNPEEVWEVTNQICEVPFKVFFNSGVIVKHGQNDFFKFWLQCFDRIMTDKRVFKIDYLHFFFLEQASFSLTVVKYFKKNQVNLLGYKYNYPVHLHKRIKMEEPPIIIHYHDEFYADKWTEDFPHFFSIPKEFETMLPFSRHRKSVVAKIRQVAQFQLYKLKYKYRLLS